MAKALTSAALLAAIASGEVSRITETQAATLNPAHFEVNQSDVTKEGAAVRLTDLGRAAASAATAPAKAGMFEIDSDVPMPAKVRRSAPRETIYPFDALEVGQSFHVPATAENENPALRLSSSVSAVHVRFSPVLTNEDGSPVLETYKRPTYERGEDGKFAKDENGKRVVTGEEELTREKRGEPSRKFRIVPVDETDKRGPGARVYRYA